jgi:phospholipid transport system substrate-binding protein
MSTGEATMRGLRVSILAVILALTMAVPAGAAPTQQPDEFIRSLSSEAIGSLTGHAANETDREQKFRTLFTNNFDVPQIAQFVLGLYWPRATQEQRAEYVRLFEDFVVKSYAKKFGDYSGDGFKTGAVTKVASGDSVVSSQIRTNENKPPVRVDWRVRANDSQYKIVDVMVEGISMSVTHRDEFAAVIRNSGGTVAGLIDALRKKTVTP